MRIDWKYLFLLLLLLAWLGFSIYTYTYFKGECKQSSENPFVYSAKKADAIECSCRLNNGQTLLFNQERAWYPITIKAQKFDYNFTIDTNAKEVE